MSQETKPKTVLGGASAEGHCVALSVIQSAALRIARSWLESAMPPQAPTRDTSARGPGRSARSSGKLSGRLHLSRHLTV